MNARSLIEGRLGFGTSNVYAISRKETNYVALKEYIIQCMLAGRAKYET